MSSIDIGTPWPARGANQWGHWGAQMLVGAIVATVLLVLRPLPADNPAALFIPVALFLFVIGSWIMMRQHDRRLCEHCMSSMPLDASAVAARYGRRFTFAHLGSNRRWVVGYLVVLIGSNFVLLDTALLPASASRWVWAAVQATMIYLILAYSTHRKLQPWCPQCRDDGGGDTVDAPEPVPTGSQHA